MRSGRYLQNSRGAAFLLSVYIAALTLLLLGGVSLQRTATEVRAADISRNSQQAFFLAEGGLDQALKAVETADTASDAMPTGTYDYAVTRQLEVLSPQTMRTTYTLTSTGTAFDHRQATVSGQIVKEEPLQGAFAQGKISSGGCSSNIIGSIHSGQGTPRASKVPARIEFDGSYTTVSGDVTIDPRNATTPYTDRWGLLDSQNNIAWGTNPGILLRNDSYTSLFGYYDRGTPLTNPDTGQQFTSKKELAEWIAKQIVTGHISTVDLKPITPLSTPALVRSAKPAKALVLKNSSTDTTTRVQQIIADNGPWDANATTGQITLRLTKLQLWPRTQLVFTAPATIYVEGYETITPPPVHSHGEFSKKTKTAVFAGEDTSLVALDPNGQTIKGGIEIIVTQLPAWDTTQPGAVLVTSPEAFYSSIWAPESPVVVAGWFPQGRYDPARDEIVGALGQEAYDPRLPDTKWTPSYGTWGDLYPAPPVVGGLIGVESRYIVANDLYTGGDVVIGKAGNQPPQTSQSSSSSTTSSDSPTLSIWKLDSP